MGAEISSYLDPRSQSFGFFSSDEESDHDAVESEDGLGDTAEQTHKEMSEVEADGYENWIKKGKSAERVHQTEDDDHVNQAQNTHSDQDNTKEGVSHGNHSDKIEVKTEFIDSCSGGDGITSDCSPVSDDSGVVMDRRSSSSSMPCTNLRRNTIDSRIISCGGSGKSTSSAPSTSATPVEGFVRRKKDKSHVGLIK
jgi:hypothetical protein